MHQILSVNLYAGCEGSAPRRGSSHDDNRIEFLILDEDDLQEIIDRLLLAKKEMVKL